MKLNTIVLILLIFFSFGYCITKPESSNLAFKNELPVTFKEHEAEKRIDVLINNNRLFTSFCWTEKLFKPVLYPLLSPGGQAITRGYPLDPRPGERVDHPHQIGLWLNYGDVDGFDFWNNSEAIPADKKKDFGTIRHLKIVSLVEGKGEGTLVSIESWVDPAGNELLSEDTRYHFEAYGQIRIIDRITKLTATGKTVCMKDNKEGLMAIRVARQLELPSKDEIVQIDSGGNTTSAAKMNNEGVSGNYRSSEGVTGDSVWSARAKWLKLSGTINKEKISVIMFDHPKNQSFPAYWHARGYGLFAVNPLGAGIFTKGKETLNFSIPKGRSVVFRYRLIVGTGELSDQQINSLAEDFSGKY